MSEDKIKTTAIMESERAVAFIEEILSHMKDGGAHLELAGLSMTLTPKKAVEMEIKAKHKDGKQKLSFELVWKENLQVGERSERDMHDLKVSSKKEEQADTERGHERVGTEASQDEAMPVEAALF